jgi:hypothetical protein
MACMPCYCGCQSFVLLKDTYELMLIWGHLESLFLLELNSWAPILRMRGGHCA